MTIKPIKQELLLADNPFDSMEQETNSIEQPKELSDPITGTDLSEDAIKTLYTLGFAKYQQGKYEDAKVLFRFLTLANSLDSRYWMGLAACHQKMKNYHQAIECYSVVALQDHENPYIPFHAAECYFADDQPEKGLMALESAIEAAKKSTCHQSLLVQLNLMQASWTGKYNGESPKGTIS